METRALPIGIDNFEKIRKNNFYYIDKSMLIKELIDNLSEVSLFTRPRRFGKSLNISMLQHFFEAGRDSRSLFSGLKIMKEGEKYLAHMNRYPVIMLSLKSVDQHTFDLSFRQLKEELAYEYERHRYVLESDKLSEETKMNYRALLNNTAEQEKISNSLRFLSKCLEQYYHEKAIILIDEYDVPLERAYFNGYYELMAGLIRSLLSAALKTNTALAFAVMTGCLRVSKESIFTGLNNFRIETILSPKYGEYFGFTQQEVAEGLRQYQLEHQAEVVLSWYNGYLFGNENVYNPWSVIQYIYDAKENKRFPVPYWSNTSSNNIIRVLVEKALPKQKEQIEKLVQGGTIIVPIHEDITYEDIYKSPENLWNFLFFTGYLKKCAETFQEDTIYLELSIPNKEVRYIYKRKIQEWLKDTIFLHKNSKLYESILAGNTVVFQEELSFILKRSISYMDNYENFYHGFLTGLLDGMEDYEVRSNRESGNGRGDIFIMSYYNKNLAVVIELKSAPSGRLLEEYCDKALQQMKEMQYELELKNMGYQNILKYGVAFYKKDCVVKMQKD